MTPSCTLPNEAHALLPWICGSAMTPTRIRTLVLMALACALITWLVVRMVYAELPPLPWTSLPALLLLAFAEGWTGRIVRARLRGTAGLKPLHPIAVARMAAFAKATSIVGTLFAGVSAGFLAYVSESLGKSAFRADAFVSGGTLAASVILVVAALYLEYGCRVPTSGGPRDDGQEPGPPQ